MLEQIEVKSALPPPPANVSVLRIEPMKGWLWPDLKEIWTFREMLYFLVWREVKVRYKQTALGAAWAILQPLFTMLIFSIFFGPRGRSGTDPNR